ncbi:hypothetical protein ERJ75_000520600 [Trypanosoma vivax]|nr:hypothetical protein ERJ75_000520600 [Trypanosoma vivax]
MTRRGVAAQKTETHKGREHAGQKKQKKPEKNLGQTARRTDAHRPEHGTRRETVRQTDLHDRQEGSLNAGKRKKGRLEREGRSKTLCTANADANAKARRKESRVEDGKEAAAQRRDQDQRRPKKKRRQWGARLDIACNKSKTRAEQETTLKTTRRHAARPCEETRRRFSILWVGRARGERREMARSVRRRHLVMRCALPKQQMGRIGSQKEREQKTPQAPRYRERTGNRTKDARARSSACGTQGLERKDQDSRRRDHKGALRCADDEEQTAAQDLDAQRRWWKPRGVPTNKKRTTYSGAHAIQQRRTRRDVRRTRGREWR